MRNGTGFTAGRWDGTSRNTYAGSKKAGMSAARIYREEERRERRSQARAARQSEESERQKEEMEFLRAANDSLREQNRRLTTLLLQMSERYRQLSAYVETLREWSAARQSRIAPMSGTTRSASPSASTSSD